RVPEGAPNGDYYYTFLSETQPPPTTEGIQSARAKATIGSNILITVTDSGVIDVKGKVALFDIMARYTVNLFGTQYKIFDSNDKIPFVLIVDNKGKNVIAPEGTIVIKGNFGEKAQYEIVPQNILAESQRLITATPSGNLNCPESGKKPSYCQKPISLLISGLFIGLYKASTSINFGENSPNIFASTSFIAIPFKLMIGLIVVIFIGIIIIKKMKDNEE
ncbi:MAG: hypothetical protein Q7R95_07750, partial [bacterium]|nr:hypothetical protein [bacterium]